MPPKSATLCLNAQSRALPILSKRLISDSLAAGLKTAVFNQMLSKSAILCVNTQSRALPTSQRDPRQGFQLGGSSNTVVLAKPGVSESLKETRDKDSSLAAGLKTVVLRKPGVSGPLKKTRDKASRLAAALKRRFWQSRVLPILSKRPEIRIPAWRQLSKRRFTTRCFPKVLFCA